MPLALPTVPQVRPRPIDSLDMVGEVQGRRISHYILLASLTHGNWKEKRKCPGVVGILLGF